MEQYIIKGGNPLVGEVEIGGAKNAALAILAAAIMTDETVLIENLPDVNDVNVMLEAISGIGAMVQRIDRHTAKINGSTIGDFNIEYDYIKKIRASYYLLGALLGKYRKAEVALPGGCNIGSRPIDQHLKGFRALGADVDIEHGKIVAEAERLHGTHLYFDVVSVGATNRCDQDPRGQIAPQDRVLYHSGSDRGRHVYVCSGSYQRRCYSPQCDTEAS